MEKRLRTKIRNSIFDLLKEQSDEEETPAQPRQKKSSSSNAGVISTKGAFGTGGRAKRFVAEAGARASSDPEGLLNDLGIKKEVSGSDLEQALKIINAAIHTNSLMSQAYTGAKETSDTVKGASESQRLIAINVSKIDRKNGVRFLAHTLTAAVNAGYLNLKGGLQFGQGSISDIVVYVM